MLKSTFHHIPGIGIKTEKHFWRSGIFDWDSFQSACFMKLSPNQLAIIKEYLFDSKDQLAMGNPSYFTDLLPSSLHWRIFPEFRHAAVYLDIETNGLSSHYGFITTIALYDGASVSYYVKGHNLEDFKHDIQKYKVIISYNGKSFDIPFIERYFGIRLNHAHIDLRHILGSLGYRGGLKGCEMALGIDRGDLTGVDGYFAVLLWELYQQTGNERALETLLAYNIEDVLNLETLMVTAYNNKLQDTPFYRRYQLDIPSVPKNPLQADKEIIQAIRSWLTQGIG